MPGRFGFNMERHQERREQRGKNGLADPSQTETHHSDAKLSCAQVRVKLAEDMPRDFGPTLFSNRDGIQLRFPDSYQRKFRSNKKAVEQNQPQNEENFPNYFRTMRAVFHYIVSPR